jgi:hypothetical protein
MAESGSDVRNNVLVIFGLVANFSFIVTWGKVEACRATKKLRERNLLGGVDSPRYDSVHAAMTAHHSRKRFLSNRMRILSDDFAEKSSFCAF